MPEIVVNPFIMSDVKMKVGADNYEAHLSTVRFDPTAASTTFQGLAPDAQFSFVGKATWVCAITYAQDWNTPNSLSRYLYEHDGDEVAVEFEPVSGGSTISATLIVTPGSIGGDVNAVATASVTLGVKGRPELGEVPAP